MSTPPPPRSLAITQNDLTSLVNSSVAAGISAFQQAQASTSSSSTLSPANTVAGTIAGVESVDIVGLKLSTFWTDRPSIWFKQAEAQFLLKKITTESTKYHHVLVALDNRTSAEVEHVIAADPPEEKPYTALKAALLDAFERTPAQMDREFMAIKSLGDLTPTALLRKMRRLRPKVEHESALFRFGFFRVLPTEISNILVVFEHESLDVLAKKADRILEQKNDAPGSVAAISTEFSHQLSIGEVDAVRRFFRGDTRGADSRDSGGNRSSRPEANPFICRNHLKWGTKAFSCKSGCLYADLPLAKKSGNSNAGR